MDSHLSGVLLEELELGKWCCELHLVWSKKFMGPMTKNTSILCFINFLQCGPHNVTTLPTSQLLKLHNFTPPKKNTPFML